MLPIQVRQLRLALFNNGFHPVKVRTGGKEPIEKGWQKITEARSAPQWEADSPTDDALNTGILTSGLCAIDVDVDIQSVAQAVANESLRLLGAAPVRYRSNSSRCLLLYRAKTNIRKQHLSGEHGSVEALASGQQFVVFGQHPSGAAYEWSEDVRLRSRDSLVEVTAEQLQLFFDAIREIIRAPESKRITSLPAQFAQAPGVRVYGQRDYASAEAALKNETQVVAAKREPGRDNAVTRASFSLGTCVGAGLLEEQRVIDALLSSCEVNGLVAEAGAPKVLDTIKRGLASGINRNPREPLPDLQLIDLSCARINGVSFADIPASLGLLESDARWPAALSDAAYSGIPGEFVRLVAPQTEGDPAALLLAFLTVMGAIFGRSAWLSVGPTQHFPNLFSVIVAETSKGRKGTVMSEAKRFAQLVDPAIKERMVSGLSSGEGLIEAVRDPREEEVVQKNTDGKLATPQRQIVDKGVTDKRLLVTEGEMGAALTVASREGNTLSATLRLAWDGDELRTLARSNKNVCRAPHISIFGNITVDELQRLLTATDRANGFANRFLWVCARRSNVLPWGGMVDPNLLSALAHRTAECVTKARYWKCCGWMPEAAQLWEPEYKRLSDGKPGMAGAMLARAEAQVIRLALIYALLDGTNNIHASHLRAALEVWRYCEDSTHYIFGAAKGDATADKIVSFLQSVPQGATLTDISAQFGRNKSSEELRRALAALANAGKVQACRMQQPGRPGRPAEVWTIQG